MTTLTPRQQKELEYLNSISNIPLETIYEAIRGLLDDGSVGPQSEDPNE